MAVGIRNESDAPAEINGAVEKPEAGQASGRKQQDEQ